jgi:predicted phage-related endonuclease
MSRPQELFEDDAAIMRRWCVRYQTTNTEAWLAGREKYINATETPCLLGVGHHSMNMLWHIKLGLRTEAPPPPHIQEILDRGHEDEPHLVMDLLVTLPKERYTCFPVGRCISESDPRVAATPDRLLWDHRRMEWYGIECKSRQNYNSARIPTLCNYVQIMQQMFCAGTKKTFYICNNLVEGPQKAVHCVIMFDQEAWNYIYAQIKRFMNFMDERAAPPTRNCTGVHRDALLEYYARSVFYRLSEGRYQLVTDIPADK